MICGGIALGDVLASSEAARSRSALNIARHSSAGMWSGRFLGILVPRFSLFALWFDTVGTFASSSSTRGGSSTGGSAAGDAASIPGTRADCSIGGTSHNWRCCSTWGMFTVLLTECSPSVSPKRNVVTEGVCKGSGSGGNGSPKRN